MFYQNASNSTKTFHGVEFKPGEILEVSGYINDPLFVRCEEVISKPAAKSSKSKKGESKDTRKDTKSDQHESEKVEILNEGE